MKNIPYGFLGAIATVLLGTAGCDERPKDGVPEVNQRPSQRPPPPPKIEKGREEFRSLQAALDGGQADYQEIWSKIGDIEDAPMDRQFLYQHCLARMSMNGFAEEAFHLIVTTFGPGVRRGGMLSFLCASTEMPLETIVRLRESLTDEADIKAVNSGLIGAVSNLPDFDALNSGLVKSIGGNASNILLKGFALYMERAAMRGWDQDAAVRKIIGVADRLESETELDSKFRSSLFGTLAKSSPFMVWELLQSDSTLDDPQLRTSVASAMAGRDPKKALETVSEKSSANEIQIIFNSWLTVDFSEASKWFDLHSTTLSSEAAGQVSSAYAENLALAGNYESAREWLGKIEDPERKKKAEEQVWTKQRDQVRSEAAKDPVATLNGIIAGHSKHHEVWIEEAMTSWIAKDPDAARQWYDSNWSAIPQSRAQYIAAAYAREAIRQADYDAADQWIARIENPAVKQRIADSMQDKGGKTDADP